MSDYWQVIRRQPLGGHQSIEDHFTLQSAARAAITLNTDYQTDEYVVIHRTTERLLESVSRSLNGTSGQNG